jgi:phage tail-like protein
MADEKNEPFGAYHFTVEFDGNKGITYPFRSCSGLKIEAGVVELEEGGFNLTTRKLIGRTKYPNIVLKRGFCSANSELYLYRQMFMIDLPGQATGKKGWQTPKRFSGVITAIGPNGRKVKWRFSNGWICKWEGPELDATKNEIAIETIEIAHEGLGMMSDAEGGGGGKK